MLSRMTVRLLAIVVGIALLSGMQSSRSAAPESSGYTMACSIRNNTDLLNVRHCAEMGAAQRCRHEAELASRASQDAVGMRIDNRSDQQIKIYWLTFSGTRKFYQTIAPGGQWTQQTYLGHNWLVTTRDDHCVGIFNASPMSLAFF